jgi:hypothetical protein
LASPVLSWIGALGTNAASPGDRLHLISSDPPRFTQHHHPRATGKHHRPRAEPAMLFHMQIAPHYTQAINMTSPISVPVPISRFRRERIPRTGKDYGQINQHYPLQSSLDRGNAPTHQLPRLCPSRPSLPGGRHHHQCRSIGGGIFSMNGCPPEDNDRFDGLIRCNPSRGRRPAPRGVCFLDFLKATAQPPKISGAWNLTKVSFLPPGP